jgi:hypothetical protein
VLVDVTTLLVERARVQLEREVQGNPDPVASDHLRRMTQIEKDLVALRRELGMLVAGEPLAGRQVSKFYEVPGQEDA